MDTTFTPLLRSYERSLRAKNRSANTIRIYLGCAEQLAEYLLEHGREEWADVTRGDIEGWIGERLKSHSAGDARNKFASVQQLFKWLAAEDEIDSNPMDGMEPPMVPSKPVPIAAPETLIALFKCCAGKDMINRRDTAILLLFTASGVRLTEMSSMRLDGLDLDRREVAVHGKGRKERVVKFDHGTALAIDRYLRSRDKEKYRHRPELWLGEKNKGPLGREGVYQMVKRRAAMAGIPKLYPHMFRHTYAHRWLDAGGAEGDLMEQMGWTSPQMLQRYGAIARADRARSAYDRINPMDGL